ncbi:MAG: hypothetical protein AAB467_04455 [Patescibacteria group bacterium]
MIRYQLTFLVFQDGSYDETLEPILPFESAEALATALMRLAAQQSARNMHPEVYPVWGDGGVIMPGSLEKGYGPGTHLVVTKFERVD